MIHWESSKKLKFDHTNNSIKYQSFKYQLNDQTVLFQTIQLFIYTVKQFQAFLRITDHSIKHHSFLFIQLNDQTDLFPTIQFYISHLFSFSLNVKQNSSIRSIERTLTGTTTLSHSGPGSNGNEGYSNFFLSF